MRGKFRENFQYLQAKKDEKSVPNTATAPLFRHLKEVEDRKNIMEETPDKAQALLGIPLALIEYVETCIMPLYDAFDSGHRQDHVRSVIRDSLDLASRTGARRDMAYAIAAFHDTGLGAGRERHHLEGARILLEDERLRDFFTREELEVMAQAVIDHRASSKSEPQSLYGKIVAEADRLLDARTVITRCVQYGLDHYPDYSMEAQRERCVGHLKEKYGRGGYLKLFLEDSPNKKRLEQLRELLDDDKGIRKLVEESIKEQQGR